MPSGFYYCNACKEQGKSTSMPADEIGAALMQAHLEEKHGAPHARSQDLHRASASPRGGSDREPEEW